MIAFLTDVAAGLRMALTLLAVMVLLSQVRAAPATTHPRAFHDNRLGWSLVALAALTNSPHRALDLLGIKWVSTLAALAAEIAATGLCAGAFILVIAARSRVRGVSERLVRRAIIAQLGIVLAFVGAAMT